MSFPFQKPVQLVTLDRRLLFFPRSVLEYVSGALSIFQFTKKPSQTVYLKSNFQVQGVLGYGRKQIIPYIQVIKTFHIDQEKNSDLLLSDALYDKLLLVKTKKEFVTFVEKWNFNIIPREDDFIFLSTQYQQAGVQEIPVSYLFIEEDPKNPSRVINIPEDQKQAIKKINLNFLWKKTNELKKFAREWESREQQEHMTLWLNRELELVSPFIIANQGHAMKNVRIMRNSLIEPLRDIVGMRKMNTLEPLLGYRVYGGFALCCLEFLHDMENGLRVFPCERCGTLRKRKQSSKRKLCTKMESKKCFLTRQSDRQKRLRERKKLAR